MKRNLTLSDLGFLNLCMGKLDHHPTETGLDYPTRPCFFHYYVLLASSARYYQYPIHLSSYHSLGFKGFDQLRSSLPSRRHPGKTGKSELVGLFIEHYIDGGKGEGEIYEQGQV